MGMRAAEVVPESFNDSKVIEPAGVNDPQTEQSQPKGVDSFDSPDLTSEEQEVKLKELNEESQVDKLDEEENTGDSKADSKQKKDDKEEDKEDDGKEDDKAKQSEDKKDDEGEKPRGRTVRVKDGDKATDVSLEATVPVKVKGRKEFVSIKELRENYSGKVVYEEKMEEAVSAQEKAEHLNSKTTQEKQEIEGHLTKIADMLDADDVDPLKPLMYLVEMSGRNVLDYTKKVYSSLSDTVHDLDDMDDVERQLYWQSKELQFVKDNQAARSEQSKQAETEKGRIAKIDQIRESQGVSEEQYVEAYDGLRDLGYKEDDISPEAIVNYSVMVPHYEKAEGVCNQFDEDLTDDQMDTLVENVARTSRAYPKLSDKRILQISAENLGWELDDDDSDIGELNSTVSEKTNQAPPQKYKPTPEGQVESFDDFDF